MNADDGLEDIRWIRGLGGEKLPAASYGLLPNMKNTYFLPSEREPEFLSPVFTQQRPNVFVSDAWPAPATYHRHCDQRVGRSPKRARPVQISWRSRWFCRSMSVEDSESRRFEWTVVCNFLRPILAQDPPRNDFFRFFPFFFEIVRILFLKKISHSVRYNHLMADIFEIHFFFLPTSRFHCHRSNLRDTFLLLVMLELVPAYLTSH